MVVVRDRYFLSVAVRVAPVGAPGASHAHLPHLFGFIPQFELNRTIHVPGLRGNPERGYSRTTLSTIAGLGGDFRLFPGTFERYVATVIAGWQDSGDSRLDDLQAMLRALGLGRRVAAERVDDTQIEWRVGAPSDVPWRDSQLISIAHVGFGVSQVLPVLVALLVADAGQLVYVEQPELHLHPRAQCALASILADAARRGVRLIVGTHSALLLTSIEMTPDVSAVATFDRTHWKGSPEYALLTRYLRICDA